MPDDFSLLLDPPLTALLEHCFVRPRSVQDLADLTGTKPNTAFTRVRRLERAGVLRVVRTEGRAGKSVKFYAPTRDSFEIPFTRMPDASYTEFVQRRFGRILRGLLGATYHRLNVPDAQYLYRLSFQAGYVQAGIRREGMTEQDTHAWLAQERVVHRWVPLNLTPDELTELHADLPALTAKYARPLREGDEQMAALGLFLLPHGPR